MTDSKDALRQRLEADLTSTRIAELRLAPVQGKFDVDHLREIHRRIFQDLPSVGFPDATPGQFRPPVDAGVTWMKHRALETMSGPLFVAYSKMDDAAKQRLEEVLQNKSVDALAQLGPKDFAATFGKIYTELDYLHPFLDGNSRTLRSFTSQLAEAAGYTVNWERFSTSPQGRDALYIARDLAVNKLAKPDIEHPNSMMRIVGSMSRLQGHPELSDLLADAIRPGRSVAFERAERDQAVKAHPELAPAYDVLDAASKYMASEGWNAEKTKTALQDVKATLLAKMDAGEIVHYDQRNIEQAKSPVRTTLQQERGTHGPDLER
ncbi:Fic family protein [Massilia putida]|uniref:Fic family protein n=1 Tax=Massilia putida TaxID=1141883 RepID=UPI000952EAD6|nr:Fic family protein [Massilia putida]